MVCPPVWVVTVNEPEVPGCPATQVAGNTMAFAPAARIAPLVVQVIVLLVHTAGQPVFTAVTDVQLENDATGVGTEVR